MNYQKQAAEFAKKVGLKMTILDEDYKCHFEDDKKNSVYRWVFKCRLQRNGKSFTVNFGQSLQKGGESPSLYDVLSCLQKYDVGTFQDFCGEFGYDDDSRTAERIYKAVCKEFAGVERLFSDVIEELQEIQ